MGGREGGALLKHHMKKCSAMYHLEYVRGGREEASRGEGCYFWSMLPSNKVRMAYLLSMMSSQDMWSLQ